MLTETLMNFSVRVSSMTVAWNVPAGTVTVAASAPWTVTWVLTVRVWPAMPIVAVIVLVCGWPDMICGASSGGRPWYWTWSDSCGPHT
jgi:hypothetical protein